MIDSTLVFAQGYTVDGFLVQRFMVAHAVAGSFLLHVTFTIIGVTLAALPTNHEYERLAWCYSIHQFVDLVSQARAPEELPPCVPACPSGTDIYANQCAKPPAFAKQLRLRFELHEHCQKIDCKWLGNSDLRRRLLGLKLSQFFSIPVQEIKGSSLSWAITDWPPPADAPRLEKFTIARRGEADFLGRRLASTNDYKWYVLRYAFRVDSRRISVTSESVETFLKMDNAALLRYFGTRLELHKVEAETNDPDNELYQGMDYRTLYRFQGFGLNVDPFNAQGLSSSSWHCRDPCYSVDEEANNDGPHRCSVANGACDCKGERDCSGYGYCIGNGDTCQTQLTTPSASGGSENSLDSKVVPGFVCVPSTAPSSLSTSGAYYEASSLEGCAIGCREAPTCVSIEWRNPNHCVLSTHLASSALNYAEAAPSLGNETWFSCVRLETTLQGTTSKPSAGETATSFRKQLPIQTTTRLRVPNASSQGVVTESRTGYGSIVVFLILVICIPFLFSSLLILFFFRRNLCASNLAHTTAFPVKNVTQQKGGVMSWVDQPATEHDTNQMKMKGERNTDAKASQAASVNPPESPSRKVSGMCVNSVHTLRAAADALGERRWAQHIESNRLGSVSAPPAAPKFRRSRSASAVYSMPECDSSPKLGTSRRSERARSQCNEPSSPVSPIAMRSRRSWSSDTKDFGHTDDQVSQVSLATSPAQLELELSSWRAAPLAQRRRLFLALCLRWHPDKNSGNESNATQMFQLLQEKKEWFLSYCSSDDLRFGATTV